MHWLSWIERVRQRGWIGYLTAVGGDGMGCTSPLILSHNVFSAPFFMFVPGIMLAALLGGVLPAALAIFAAILLANGFVIPRLDADLPKANILVVTVVFTVFMAVIVGLIEFTVRTATRLTEATAQLRASNATLEQRVTARAGALMQAEAQLRQSQKIEAVGTLTGGIAHDFNNLLTNIGVSLEMLETLLAEGGKPDAARMGMQIDQAQTAVRRAAELTHQLLAFSRRQILAPKPTDINRMIGGMEPAIRRAAGPVISVELLEGPGLWPAMVDPRQLEVALLNLCINAADAMPHGGHLTVESGNRTIGDDRAVAIGIEAGQYVSLCVSDTGMGMSPEVQARVFDPFFTTKKFGQGPGLGLSMIHGFIRQSGGQIRLESQPGEGTIVTMLLPRHVPPAPPPPAPVALAPVKLAPAKLAPVTPATVTPAPAAAPGPAARDKIILVVDDEMVIRSLAAASLRKLGYHAIEAADAEEGLEVLHDTEAVDLLVTDIGLPGMNGQDFADEARRLRPGLKVLFITGYADTQMHGDGELAIGLHVLTKPFTMATLSARIRDILDI
jgi:signal transduction histidine kinase